MKLVVTRSTTLRNDGGFTASFVYEYLNSSHLGADGRLSNGLDYFGLHWSDRGAKVLLSRTLAVYILTRSRATGMIALDITRRQH